MVNVVVFLIEHFPDIQACPTGDDLGAMLEHAGFSDDEIGTALLFVQLLSEIPQFERQEQSSKAFRVYNPDENDALPTEVRSLLHFLETAGALNAVQREFVIHALMHLPYDEITLDNAKMLAVLVLWAHRSELPVLIGDELMAVLHGRGVMH